MRIIHDISMTIKNGMLVYPGDPGVSLKRVKEIGHGSSANLSEYCMGSHTGTHVDPPFHFLPEGAKVDAMPLSLNPNAVTEAPSSGDVIHTGANTSYVRPLVNGLVASTWPAIDSTILPSTVNWMRSLAFVLDNSGLTFHSAQRS